MELRRIHIAALSRFRDGLTPLHRFAALDFEIAIIRVSRHETVWMADQNQIAVALQFAAGIGDDTALRRLDRSAFGDGYVDAIIAAGLEALNDAAARGPAEFRIGAVRGSGRLAGIGG